ncbi:MAG: hypothetical protein M5U01_03155 [Ardenticatenaceae bacterium]|nr:hypothetical protein [Ardenticatenaceae bacterium]
MIISLDCGISNIDVVAGDENGVIYQGWTLPSPGTIEPTLLTTVLDASGRYADSVHRFVVTGGRSRWLPAEVAGRPVQVVDEILAIGRGGVVLGQLDEALVVSAGSGTALVAAHGRQFHHVGGSAVGGGTLLGLSQLLLQTSDPAEIERLAQAGVSAGVDLTIGEVIGGEVGILPVDATAVNFGRAARPGPPPARADIAAGLTTLVAQTVGILACISARGLGLDQIVILGHMTDMPSIVAMLQAVGHLYGRSVIIPPSAGLGVAIGALHEALDLPDPRG